MMREQLVAVLRLYCDKSTPVVIAVSGGVDSMVLVDVCRHFFSLENIYVMTVDHDYKEENHIEHVQSYCKKYGIQFYHDKIDWLKLERKTEETMRDKRYDLLRKYAERVQAKYIITAHHLNDCIETFLFRLTRGSSLNGLVAPRILDRDIFRPLLYIPKDELLNYANENQITWVEDVLNSDLSYARNKIRHQIVPILGELHPHMIQNFKQLFRDLLSFNDFHAWFIDDWLKKHPIPFTCTDFLDLPEIIQKELLSSLVRKHGEVLSRGHLDEALKVIRRGVGNKEVLLKKGLYLRVKEKRVYIENR